MPENDGSVPGMRLVRPLLRALLSAVVTVAILSFARSAHAYAWMIRESIVACQECHADPSGGGLLTPFGRLIGESTMRTLYGPHDTGADPYGAFLFGVPLPDALLMGGDLRYFGYSVKTGDAPAQRDNFIMQADLEGQVTVGRFRANGSIGYADQGALSATITHASEKNLVSRVYWVGVDLGDKDEFLLRAGRLNLPFGIRSIEHTFWVRTTTRTDINDNQQDGVALAYNVDHWRVEVMAILGNYQIDPDTFRERGYSAYVEYAPIRRLAVGASSKITHANTDLFLGTEAIRQDHGLFARWSPIKPFVLLGEADFTFSSQPATPAFAAINTHGYVGMLQGDVEAIQGLHLMATGELWSQQTDTGFPSVGGWGSVAWFFAPHADVRFDGIYQSLPASPSRVGVTSLVLQGHLYL
jgi:hypothetical protein